MKLPDEYVAIPIGAGEASAALKICAVVRRTPDAVGGHLVVLRNASDARVLLGCVTDAADRVQQYVELWVQDLAGLGDTPDACREALSNAVLDARWVQHFDALKELDAVATGCETAHPLPVLLDIAKGGPVHIIDGESGSAFALCTDESLLLEKGLPAYGSTLERYLHVPELDTESRFISVGGRAGSSAEDLSSLMADGLVPLNPAGGLLMVRPHVPLKLEEYLTVLNGGSWHGVWHGRSVIDTEGWGPSLSGAEGGDSDGRLFGEVSGVSSRLVETFHLKLRLLADATAAVRHLVARTQRPLLNLTPESFAVRMAQPGCGLPFLWTARTQLVAPGESVALNLKESSKQYFIRTGPARTSVYYPAFVGIPTRGRGGVRIVDMVEESGDKLALSGSFVSREEIDATANDLIWLRFHLSCGQVDVYAHLADDTRAAGQWQFRTLARKFDAEARAAIEAAVGVEIPNALFEVVYVSSTPCDLYALAVIAVQTLLVNKQARLALALDSMQSLVRQASACGDGGSLPERIESIFVSDERWQQALGPDRLTDTPITPGEAFKLVPPSLWFETLAMIARQFPGLGPDSVCADYGDARTGALEDVFDGLSGDLERLLLRSRSLIMMDWPFNRDVRAAIQRQMDELAVDLGDA